MTKSRLFKKLSTREVEVLKLLSSGKKNKEIAKELEINEKNSKVLIKLDFTKNLVVNNIVDLIHQSRHHELV